jgi:hypothetical protein
MTDGRVIELECWHVGKIPMLVERFSPALVSETPRRESAPLPTVGRPEKSDSHIQMRNWLFPRSSNALLHV